MSEHDVPDGVEFVQHEPCDNCGSSDAAARYSDDHLYCFSCHHYTPPQHNKKDNEVPTNAVADQGCRPANFTPGRSPSASSTRNSRGNLPAVRLPGR